jgi:hypothetical protein
MISNESKQVWKNVPDTKEDCANPHTELSVTGPKFEPRNFRIQASKESPPKYKPQVLPPELPCFVGLHGGAYFLLRFSFHSVANNSENIASNERVICEP